MKFNRKILAVLSGIFLLAETVYADALTEKTNDINNAFDDFSISLNKTLPSAAVQQNVYSDAWIGKLLPSIPPHFALGIEGGVSKLDTSALSKAAKSFDINSIPENLVFPTLAANARIGGFFLPFDIGFSFLTFNANDLKNFIPGLGFKYFDIGGDIRFALLQGNGAWPKLSLGVGYYYTYGTLSYKNNDFDMAINFSANVLTLNLQLSKTFIFVTPFIGFRGIFSNLKTDWDWKIDNSLMAQYGISSPSGSGSASRNFGDSFVPQVYGGLGISLSLFNIDLNGGWDFRNQIWSAGLSFRFKI